jgi:hypothetical protein
MDQNLEPKGDPVYRKVKAKRVCPEDVGVYFLGESDETSFVGYMRPTMTDKEIQEYIEVQERLAAPCMKERKSRSQAPVGNTNTTAGGLFYLLAKALETTVDAEDEEGKEEARS